MTEARDTLSYIQADEKLRDLVIEQWKEWFPSVGRYISLEDGFTIVAMDGEHAVGLHQLPPLAFPHDASILRTWLHS